MTPRTKCAVVRARIGLMRVAVLAALLLRPTMVHAAVYYQTSNQQFVIGNDRVELTFSTVNASLRNLIDKTTGVDLISRKVGNYNGFVFTYTAPSDTAVQNSGGYLPK